MSVLALTKAAKKAESKDLDWPSAVEPNALVKIRTTVEMKRGFDMSDLPLQLCVFHPIPGLSDSDDTNIRDDKAAAQCGNEQTPRQSYILLICAVFCTTI